MVNKKAQLKIQQMAFMLIAVTIFFVVVGLFALVFRFAGLKESANLLEEKNALLLVTKLANSPEFSCGDAFGNKANCIDLEKFKAMQSKKEDYYKFWGDVSNIILRVNEQDYDLFEKGARGFPVENFVSVCSKESESGQIYDKCDIGRLMIYYEDK